MWVLLSTSQSLPPCLSLENQLPLHREESGRQANPPQSPGDGEGQTVGMGSPVEEQAHPCEEQTGEEGGGGCCSLLLLLLV